MPQNASVINVFDRIANFDGQFLRVLAGPGTGKTYSLMNRLKFFLEQGIDPREILLLTFARVSARDLVRKVSELGIAVAQRVRATTLHSFCFSMLQQEQVIRATGRTPRPLLRFELEALYYDLKHQNLGGIRQLRKDVIAFESAWARLQREQPGWAQSAHDQSIEEAVLSWLRFHESMLIGELVPIALQYLRDNPATPIRGSFEHVLVDEYQDLNRAEQVLIDSLSENASLTIAGDDDQSIYSFKYAHPEGIIEFDETHTGTHDEVLEECRRCPQSVIRVARELIRRNQRYPKRIVEHPETIPGAIASIQWRGLRKEARGISEIIEHYITNHNILPGRVLVLAQRRNIASMISDELEGRHMETVNYYNEDVLDNPIAQDRFTLLCLLANPQDRTSLRNWLAFESTTRRVSPYARLREFCEASGVSPRQGLSQLAEGDLVLPHCQTLIERYQTLLRELEQMNELCGHELVDACFPEDDDNCAKVRQLALEIVRADMRPMDLMPILREGIAQPEIPLERTKVSIMSLHKAKGLEADLVVIPSCVEGLIPRIDNRATPTEQQQQLEENRRLFFVGVTRTRNVLVLSSVLYMRRGDAVSMGLQFRGNRNIVRLVASRFIGELGPSSPQPQTGEQFINCLQIDEGGLASSVPDSS